MSTQIKVDVEQLIELVEQRPILWDKTININGKKSDAIRIAWAEVFRAICCGYDSFGVKKKRLLEETVKSKWSSLRDAWYKCYKRQAQSDNQGQSQLRAKKVPFYYDRMKFLLKLYDKDDTLRQSPKDGEFLSTTEALQPRVQMLNCDATAVPNANVSSPQNGTIVNVHSDETHYSSVLNLDVPSDKISNADGNSLPLNVKEMQEDHKPPPNVCLPCCLCNFANQSYTNTNVTPIKTEPSDLLESTSNQPFKMFVENISRDDNIQLFFKTSILPEVGDFDSSQTLDFKLGILELLKSIKYSHKDKKT